MGTTVYAYYSPSAHQLLEEWARHGPRLLRSLVHALNRHIEGPRNRRSREYMETLAKSVLHGFATANITFLTDARSIRDVELEAAENVLLIWPDANGLSWSPVERHIFKNKPASVSVRVLNGRRRFFELTPTLWRKYRWRRFLEKAKVGEWVLLAGFTLVTPFLLAWDLFRGRW